MAEEEINYNNLLDCIYNATELIEIEFYSKDKLPIRLYRRFWFKPDYILPSKHSADERPHIEGDWFFVDNSNLSLEVITAIKNRMLKENTDVVDRVKVKYKG